jgi:hypothetical protein
MPGQSSIAAACKALCTFVRDEKRFGGQRLS